MSTLSSELGLRLTSLCDALEKELVGRCIKIFRFEPHPRRKVLIVVGEVTITAVVPTTGKVIQQWTEEFRKCIQLLGLNASSNIDKIAKDVLITYSYIDDSLLGKLKEVIEEIKSRDYDHNGIVILHQMANDGSFLPRYPEIFDEFDTNDGILSGEVDEPDFGKLEDYIEQLYEDIPQKIEAAIKISKLTKFNSYLQSIVGHDSATNALFRTLREDSKKSTQLTKIILRICLDFARVKEFQTVLIKHKIPQLTLDIIDFELERCEKWKAKLNLMEQTSLLKPPSSRSLNEYHLMLARLDELISTQNSLLKVGFEILHYVSENITMREILLKQRVVTSLIDALNRQDNDLLDMILTYLKDLSSFKQCIEHMIIAEVVDKLAMILKGGTPLPRRAVNASLHLIYNLSFHTVLRERMLKCGFISVLTNCFEKSSFQEIAGKALYVLSMDANVRSKLAKSSFISTLMNLITSQKEPLDEDFGCLAVNLSRNKRCANLMWESNKVNSLVKLGTAIEDLLAMKIIRNLAEQDAAFVLYEYAGKIAGAIIGSTNQEFVTECISILACFDPSRISVEDITQRGRIFSWLKQTLSYYIDLTEKEFNEPGVMSVLVRSVIEVVLLLGNLCKSEEGARIIVGEGFAELFMRVLHLPGSDEKILYQILYAFKKCTEHESISVFFAIKTRIPSGLLEFAESSTGDLKKMSESALQSIAAFDDTWKENVERYNFLSWNKNWTDAISIEEIEEETENVRETTFRDFQKIISGHPGLLDNSSDSENEVDQSRWSSGLSDSDPVPAGFFGVFKQQFDEEMALRRGFGNGDLDFLENTFDSESEFGWA